MNILVIIVIKYSLGILAALGIFTALVSLTVDVKDVQALRASRENGAKKLATELRLYQNAFNLAVFSVMLMVGLVFAITPILLPPPSNLITSRIGWDVVALLLLIKQVMANRSRHKLDDHYDQHYRRKSDHPPSTGEIVEKAHDAVVAAQASMDKAETVLAEAQDQSERTE